jgi:TonB family protein
MRSIEGTAPIWLQVEPDGMAHNLRITGSLGMGVDEKALDAVRAWRFQPGEKPPGQRHRRGRGEFPSAVTVRSQLPDAIARRYSVRVTLFSVRGWSGLSPFFAARCAAKSCAGMMYGIGVITSLSRFGRRMRCAV